MKRNAVETGRVELIDILNYERKGMQIKSHPGELIGVIILSLLQFVGGGDEKED